MTSPAEAISPIRGVLDRSAIQSYGRGHVHVGEVMSEVDRERAFIAIPAAALCEAHAGFTEDAVATARLGVLINLPGAKVLDLDAAAAIAVAAILHLAGGDLSRSHAVWAALEHSAVYLTAEPDVSARLVAEDRIIEIPTEDA
jgi:hypothetical protein